MTETASEPQDDKIRRCQMYVDKMPAVPEGGRYNTAVFMADQVRVDFGLDEDQFWPILCSWNDRNPTTLSIVELRRVLLSSSKRVAREPIAGPTSADPQPNGTSAMLHDDSTFMLGFSVSNAMYDPENDLRIECSAVHMRDHEIVGLWFDAEPGYFVLTAISVEDVDLVLPFDLPVDVASFGASPRSDGHPRHVSLGCRPRVREGEIIGLRVKLRGSFASVPTLVGHVVVRRSTTTEPSS